MEKQGTWEKGRNRGHEIKGETGDERQEETGDLRDREKQGTWEKGRNRGLEKKGKPGDKRKRETWDMREREKQGTREYGSNRWLEKKGETVDMRYPSREKLKRKRDDVSILIHADMPLDHVHAVIIQGNKERRRRRQLKSKWARREKERKGDKGMLRIMGY